MHFFDSILEWAGIKPRSYWIKTISEITEQRDAFEEQCYDLRWERDLAKKEAEAHVQSIVENMTSLQAVNSLVAEERDSWMGIAVSTEKQLKELRDAHAAALEQAGLSLKQLDHRARELNEQAAIQLEMDGHRVELEKELKQAKWYAEICSNALTRKSSELSTVQAGAAKIMLERSHFEACYKSVHDKNEALLKKIDTLQKTPEHHPV